MPRAVEPVRTPRMTMALLALGALGTMAVPAAAAPGAGAPFLGPWAGGLVGGETHEHTYDNNPLNQACIEVVTTYVATLSYGPATAEVTFRVDGQAVPAGNGSAVHVFVDDYCTRVPVAVGAGAGETGVTYEVDVDRMHPLVAGLEPAG